MLKYPDKWTERLQKGSSTNLWIKGAEYNINKLSEKCYICLNPIYCTCVPLSVCIRVLIYVFFFLFEGAQATKLIYWFSIGDLTDDRRTPLRFANFRHSILGLINIVNNCITVWFSLTFDRFNYFQKKAELRSHVNFYIWIIIKLNRNLQE